MPIEVQHQPPLNLVGAAGYNAGVLEGVAKRREELWNRQMQVASLQQADRAQRLNLMSQQAAQQNANQRMLMENYLDQQNQAAQNQQRQQAFQMEQQATARRDSVLHGYDMEKFGRTQDASMLEAAHKTRAEIEQALGQAQAANLTQPGRELYDAVNNDLSELNKTADSIRPADYYHSVNEILGRSKGLSLPRMQSPTKTPQQEIDENTYVDPNGAKWRRDAKDGWVENGYATVGGRKVGEIFTNEAGQEMFYDDKGKLNPVPDTTIKQKATTRDNIRKAMAAEETAMTAAANPMPSFDARGNAIAGATPSVQAPPKPDWMSNAELREQELERRFQNEWTAITGKVSPPPAAPLPGSPEWTQGVTDRAQQPPTSAMGFPLPTPRPGAGTVLRPSVTAENPSGQPPAPEAIPSPEEAAAQVLNPQQPPAPAAGAPAGQPPQAQPQQVPAAQLTPAARMERGKQSVKLLETILPSFPSEEQAAVVKIYGDIETGKRSATGPISVEESVLLAKIKQRVRSATGTGLRGQ